MSRRFRFVAYDGHFHTRLFLNISGEQYCGALRREGTGIGVNERVFAEVGTEYGAFLYAVGGTHDARVVGRHFEHLCAVGYLGEYHAVNKAVDGACDHCRARAVENDLVAVYRAGKIAGFKPLHGFGGFGAVGIADEYFKGVGVFGGGEEHVALGGYLNAEIFRKLACKVHCRLDYRVRGLDGADDAEVHLSVGKYGERFFGGDRFARCFAGRCAVRAVLTTVAGGKRRCGDQHDEGKKNRA